MSMIQTWASVCTGRSLNCLFNGWIKLTLISPSWPLSINMSWAFSFPKIINQPLKWEYKRRTYQVDGEKQLFSIFDSSINLY